MTAYRPGNRQSDSRIDLRTKLVDARGWVSLYGTTPPRADAAEERIALAATRLVARVQNLPLDGLIVYDVQDESERIGLPRPFPFLPTIDSRRYAARLRDVSGHPVVAYKAVGPMSEAEWQPWLTETRDVYGINCLSLVGRPTSRGLPPGLQLALATRLAAAHPAGFALGGVAIAERHSAAKSESQRLVQKARDGCQFFISQAVYDADTTVRLLRDYARDCREQDVAPRRIVLTFVPCGRAKTIEFVRWLGVAITDATARSILKDLAPLSRSLQFCREHFRQILDQVAGTALPLGVNVESVSIYRDEIDATVDLVHALDEIRREYQGPMEI